MTPKIIRGAAAAAALAVVVAACGSSTPAASSQAAASQAAASQAATAAAASAAPSTAASATAKNYNIAAIDSNMSDPFWQTVQCGQRKVAQDNPNIKISYSLLPTYDTNGIQTAFNAAVLKNPDAMFLQVVSATQLVNEVKALMDKGVPVSGLSPQTPMNLLGMPNTPFDGSGLIQKFEAAIKPGPGSVLILGGQSGIPQVDVRWQGLIEQLKKDRPDLTILPVQYTGFDVNKATQMASAQIIAHRKDLKMIVGSNGPDDEGILAALKQIGVPPGELTFWDWDSTPTLIQGVKDGYIQHMMAQNALEKGEMSITMLLKALADNPSGGPIQPLPESAWPVSPLGEITPDNVNSDATKPYVGYTTDTCPYPAG